MPQENTQYDYSQLVQDLFKEAIQCLENKCHFAAIAMAWAAVDYAIDFELRGGALINLKTGHRREPVKFKPHKITDKLEKLYTLYPEMRQSSANFLLLYQGLRNPFLHIRVGDVSFRSTSLKSLPVEIHRNNQKVGELPPQPVQEIFIQIQDGPRLSLGNFVRHNLAGGENESEDTFKAGALHFAAPTMASEAVRIAKSILDQLAVAVKRYSRD